MHRLRDGRLDELLSVAVHEREFCHAEPDGQERVFKVISAVHTEEKGRAKRTISLARRVRATT